MMDLKTALFSKWGIERTMKFLKETRIGFKRWLREERDLEGWEDRKWWEHGMGHGTLDEKEDEEEDVMG